MAGLVVGPLLRYVDERRATLWMETDRRCEVEVLGRREQTFAVEGHHYALVTVEGLEPASSQPYEVALDGRTVWPPPAADQPPSVIRTAGGQAPTRVTFGSCRTVLGEVEPDDPDRIDALKAFARRAAEAPDERLPDLLVLLGDQVYGEKGAPRTREFIRARRAVEGPPGECPADFEEYTRLYHEAWGGADVRWLLSTVPSAMIFDDHDLIDNWNTSEAWVAWAHAQPWWSQRATGGLMAYWLYQHLGNLAPQARDADPLWSRFPAHRDVGPLLREWAARQDAGTHGTPGAQWSFVRDVGPIRVLMVDSRNGRVLHGGRREMLDDDEWAWLEGRAADLDGVDHLLIGTSLPFLLPQGIHHHEAWVTAVCDGRWGRLAARLAEPLRQALQFNHWVTFPASFARLGALLHGVAAMEEGATPATVGVLSGDVHYSYLALLAPTGDAPARPVWQAVSSPLCYDLERSIVGGFRALMSRPARWLATGLARMAGVRDPGLRWDLVEGPWFRNVISTATFDGPRARITFEQTAAGPADAQLRTVSDRSIHPA
jgi:hypothetical protein